MSQHIFNLWKEASSSKPIRRDAFSSMYLGRLQNAKRHTSGGQLSVIEYQIQDFVLCESKGRLQDVTSLALLCPGDDVLWFCFQFQGKTVFATGRATEPDSLFSFTTSSNETQFTLSAEKYWALFLGLSAVSKQQLLAEFPSLRHHFEEVEGEALPAVPISRPDRRLLEVFSQMRMGSFSTVYHIGHLFLQLYSNYVQRVEEHMQRIKEEPNIRLYYRAVAFIRDNCQEKILNRETIAKALHCSTRTLSRVFEGRPLSLNATILTVRLHKGRELLVRRADLSIDQIAGMLHFFDASHFITQYKRVFHCTPRQERKMLKSNSG